MALEATLHFFLDLDERFLLMSGGSRLFGHQGGFEGKFKPQFDSVQIFFFFKHKVLQGLLAIYLN